MPKPQPRRGRGAETQDVTALAQWQKDRTEAENAIHELRESAERLIQRSQEMAEESLRLKRRADDLAQLVRQHNALKK